MLNIKHSATQELVESTRSDHMSVKKPPQQHINAYEELMSGLSSVSTAGQRFTRDDMNERR